jgi:hypothetical protein
MVDFSIITARRDPETLGACVRSLRKHHDGVVHIHAEPGEYRVDFDNVKIEVHAQKKGCFANHHHALLESLRRGGDVLCVLSDDLLFGDGLEGGIRSAERLLSGEAAACCLFTHWDNGAQDKYRASGWVEDKDGKLSWNGVFVMRKDFVKKLISHEYYVNHLNNGSGMNIDSCIHETIKQMGLKSYCHNPSLCCTIGVSTIGHTHFSDGLNFRK